MISGVVRLDKDLAALARRLERGDIAVIDAADLDRAQAELLAARRPAAVLNAAEFHTGRLANLGPSVLAAAGIPMFDRFGSEILALRDGQHAVIADGVVSFEGAVIAEGKALDEAEVAAAQAAALGSRGFHLAAVGATTAEIVETERGVLLDGGTFPELPSNFSGRPALVIGPRAATPAQLAQIKPWITESHPVVLAVETAADQARNAGISPDVILGSFTDVSDAAIASAEFLIVHGDDHARGRARLEQLGRTHQLMPSGLPSNDLALLLAGRSGASVVVAAGMSEAAAEVLDGGRSAAAATALTRLELGGRLVYAGSIRPLVRPRIRTWQLLLLAFFALLALFIALLATPVGQAAFDIGPDWLQQLLSAPTSAKEDQWSTFVIT